MRLRALLHSVMHSRVTLALGIVLAVAVPALTLPRLPEVSLWPALFGLLPWVVGKYLLCPLRWRALTDAGLTRWWHVRAYAESELLGLFTPGHVGADLWRIRRLTRTGLGRGGALTSVGLDRFVGAIGLAVFVVFAGAAPPGADAAHRRGRRRRRARGRPGGTPDASRPAAEPAAPAAAGAVPRSGPCPPATSSPPRHFCSARSPPPDTPSRRWRCWAPSVPASSPAPCPGRMEQPRDGALVVSLAALGVPWMAAAAAVALKAALAWLPALLLGGVSLILTRRAAQAARKAVEGGTVVTA